MKRAEEYVLSCSGVAHFKLWITIQLLLYSRTSYMLTQIKPNMCNTTAAN